MDWKKSLMSSMKMITKKTRFTVDSIPIHLLTIVARFGKKLRSKKHKEINIQYIESSIFI